MQKASVIELDTRERVSNLDELIARLSFAPSSELPYKPLRTHVTELKRSYTSP